MITGPTIAIDGAVWTRTWFGGAVRYFDGISRGLLDWEQPVAVVAAGKGLHPRAQTPRGTEVVGAVPDSTNLYITDDPRRVSDPSGTALVVHDMLDYEDGIEVPRDASDPTPLAELAEVARHVRVVVVPSRSTMAAVRRHLPATCSQQVVVVAPAPAAALCVAHKPRKRNILLHVGARDGYKRFDMLLSAFAESLAPLDAKLLTVGGRVRLSHREASQVDSLGVRERVVSVGYVSDHELAGHYAHAHLVCQPASAEGFGFPILEAVAAGTPVVAAALPVVQEASSGGAITFTPDNTESLARALSRAWHRPPDQRQLDAARDLLQARTWRDSVKPLLAYLPCDKGAER